MVTTEHRTPGAARPVQIRQYTLAGVLGTWAAAALPMTALFWGIGPLLAHALGGPFALIRALVLVAKWAYTVVRVSPLARAISPKPASGRRDSTSRPALRIASRLRTASARRWAPPSRTTGSLSLDVLATWP